MLKIVCYITILSINITLSADAWSNWAKNQQCMATIVTPHNTQEIIDIVKKAAKKHKNVRAYGTGHSWSNIVCTDGYLINTEKLNQIISVDKAKQQVTVQAGIKLYDLNEQLAQHGLSLSNQTAITKQSLAGVVSTASHGSGKTGTLASFITKIQLITADGSLKSFSETQNGDLFPAVRTSIGSLGIITELTIQCEPLFQVQQEITTMSWDRILHEYETLLINNDYLQFYWHADDDNVEIITHNRVTINIKDKTQGNKQGFSYRMLSGPTGPLYMMEEIAIPRSYFKQAVQKVRALIQKHNQKNNIFSGIQCCFVAAEKNNLLSPAADRDVVFIGVDTQSMNGYEPFFKEFYTAMLAYEGRPHWAKVHYLTKQDVEKLYGNNYQRFVTLRKKLDPNGIFSNEFTKTIFGW